MKLRFGSKTMSNLQGIMVRGILWLIVVFLFPLTWPFKFVTAIWAKQIIFFLLLLLADLLNTYILVPRLLFNNRFKTYLSVVLLTVGCIAMMMLVSENMLHIPEKMHALFNPDKPYEKGFRWRFDVYSLLITLLVFGFSTSMILVIKWQKDSALRQELEREKISSELTYLKAQMNPHFFFNTLNNIYALTSVNVSLAQQAIHKLSRMMRYMLYETQNDTTLLSKEMNFIHDYIELMKLRLQDHVQVAFNANLQNREVMIAPMLFLPFVENAFKHGVSTQQESYIFINFEQTGKRLIMTVKNSLVKKRQVEVVENSGIGLSNTYRRLELLYPGRHAVKTGKDEKEYRVTLEIDLA